MANPVVQTGPAHEPITLDELKKHLHIPLIDTDDNDLLWGFIQAARQTFEGFTNRKLVTQTLDYTIDRFPAANFIRLPGGQLQSITSLNYTDSADVTTLFAATNYDVYTASEPGELVLKDSISWPSVTLKPKGGIVASYIVGYGTGDLVNKVLRVCMKMYAGNLYIYREATSIPEENPTTSAAFNMARPHILHSSGSQPGTRV